MATKTEGGVKVKAPSQVERTILEVFTHGRRVRRVVEIKEGRNGTSKELVSLVLETKSGKVVPLESKLDRRAMDRLVQRGLVTQTDGFEGSVLYDITEQGKQARKLPVPT